MRTATARRVTTVVAGALGMLVASAPSAAADPAGPTDYRSAVSEVVPADAPIEVRIVGGDSFVELDASPGHEVLVLGYDDEPYLRISPDGRVEVNTTSPAHQLNLDRYGRDGDLALADADATPTWDTIGSDGVALWHDHRVHWMIPGRAPAGDDGLVSNWELPITVDGAPVRVYGELRLLGSPSAARWWVLAALAAVATVVAGARRGRWLAPVCAVGLAVALAAETFTLPSAARPSVVPILLAVAAALTAAATRPARWWAPPVQAGAMTALVLAAWLRVDALDRALVPGDLPDGLTRAAIALALGVGGGALVVQVTALGRRGPANPKEPVWTSPTGTASSVG